MSILRFGGAFGIAQGVKVFLNRKEIEITWWELRQIRNELHAAKGRAERIEHKRRKRKTQQEIFQLARKLRATYE